MALTLSKTGITTGGTIEASQITQSVDALTGTVAYDITISGSLTLTGSFQNQGGITGSLLGTSSYANQADSSSYALTASYVTTPTFPYTGSAEISGSLYVTNSISVTSNLNIGTSGSANNYLELNTENSLTIFSSEFIPANISVPDAWQVIKYTDKNSNTQLAYIPIYYTTA